MKKLKVNDNCIGCGACVASYPDSFEFSDQGTSKATNNGEVDEATMEEMASICPVGAIEVVDEENTEN